MNQPEPSTYKELMVEVAKLEVQEELTQQRIEMRTSFVAEHADQHVQTLLDKGMDQLKEPVLAFAETQTQKLKQSVDDVIESITDLPFIQNILHSVEFLKRLKSIIQKG